jgi:hypothetical protein
MADTRPHGSSRPSPPLAKLALPRLPGGSSRAEGSGVSKSKVAIACELCRRKRARCDGARPACRRCVDEGEECKYAARRRERLLETQQELEEGSILGRKLLQRALNQVEPSLQREIKDFLSKVVYSKFILIVADKGSLCRQLNGEAGSMGHRTALLSLLHLLLKSIPTPCLTK